MADQLRIPVGGPYFEDFEVGQVFDDAPAVTITDGLVTLHQGLCGDRLRLALDHPLAAAVTGHDQPLVHPTLAGHVAIGQTTYASQRVRGNLFYRGLQWALPVHLGDTLRTTTEVVALRQNKPKPGRAATGMVALRVQVDNQHGARALEFWRCPMIPLRDPEGDTGRADSFDAIPDEVSLPVLEERVASWGWHLDLFADAVKGAGAGFAEARAGTTFVIEGRDTITSAVELARATLNLAATHSDPQGGAYPGRRLVYGGHTISVAGAHASRALPGMVTILGWRSCDHTGPVFEGDVLRTEVTVADAHPLPGGGGIAELHALVWAEPAADAATKEGGAEQPVLDWRFFALLA